MKILKNSVILASLFLYCCGCDWHGEKGQGVPGAAPKETDSTTVTQKVKGKIAEFKGDVMEAKANLSPVKGNEAKGEIFFTLLPEGVRIVGDFDGLPPGKHGLHIHEKGDCSATDASSAGEHFNPTHSIHGGPDSSERHAGDLGNIVADEQGRAHYEWTSTMISLGGENSVVGRSVVIQANVDDFVSQPPGNSGARISCGIIEATK